MMALRSCLFGALLILSVFSTQSLAARRLDKASAPHVDAEPDRNVYPKPPDPVPPAEATVLDDEPKKTDQHTASDGTNQLPKTKKVDESRKTEVQGKAETKKINESRKTEVQGKAAVKPKDCNDDCGDCDDFGGDDMGGGGGGGDDIGGDGGDAMPSDCGQFWNGGGGGDDDTGGGGDMGGGGGGGVMGEVGVQAVWEEEAAVEVVVPKMAFLNSGRYCRNPLNAGTPQ